MKIMNFLGRVPMGNRNFRIKSMFYAFINNLRDFGHLCDQKRK